MQHIEKSENGAELVASEGYAVQQKRIFGAV